MKKVLLAAAAATPVGVLNGDLSGLTEQALAALVMREAVARSGVDARRIDEAVVGTAKQTSLPSNCGRYSALLAGLPLTLSAYTVQRQSASGLQALANGCWQILNGDAGAVLAAGTESMSRIPLEVRNARYAFNEHTEIEFHPIEAQLAGAQPRERYGVQSAGSLALHVAEKYAVSPEARAEYAARSLALARAHAPGPSVLPLDVKKGKVMERVERDQLYADPADTARPADGAAAFLLLSEARAAEWGPPVLAELLCVTAAAGDPLGDGLLGLDAAARALKKTGLRPGDVALIELGELSAAQALASRAGLARMGFTAARTDGGVNPGGGFLASGNPWGAGGALLTARLVDELRGTGKLGMALSPSEGGQSMAAILRVY